MTLEYSPITHTMDAFASGSSIRSITAHIGTITDVYLFGYLRKMSRITMIASCTT